MIAGFIRYDLCKTCKTDNNHQRDSCINCRNKREAPEILRDFCQTMMTIVNELLGLSKAYKFPFGGVRNAFYWHFCQRQKAEITHAFNLITHRPHFFLNKPKGSFHLRFSGIRPLRGYLPPPTPLTESQSEKKKVFFLSGKGGYPPPP